MYEALNPALVVLITLVLWLPSLQNLLAGNLNAAGAAVRFGLALAVSWLGNEAVRRVVNHYSRQNRKARAHANRTRPTERPVSRLTKTPGPDGDQAKT
jgi:hypothetical protein